MFEDGWEWKLVLVRLYESGLFRMSVKGGRDRVREIVAFVRGLVCKVLIVNAALVFCDVED